MSPMVGQFGFFLSIREIVPNPICHYKEPMQQKGHFPLLFVFWEASFLKLPFLSTKEKSSPNTLVRSLEISSNCLRRGTVRTWWSFWPPKLFRTIVVQQRLLLHTMETLRISFSWAVTWVVFARDKGGMVQGEVGRRHFFDDQALKWCFFFMGSMVICENDWTGAYCETKRFWVRRESCFFLVVGICL